MKLVLTLMVRDEEEILDANLRYHFAAGVDFAIATDNLSVDRSREILRRYERDGRLRVLEEPGDNYDQSRWVTRMARLAAEEHDADWVINADVDEFWMPEAGSLKDVLASVPWWRDAAKAERTNFVPRPQSTEPFFRSMTVRDRLSVNAVGKPLPAKVCHRARASIEVGTGSHMIFRRRLFRRRLVRPLPVPITILHFAIRSWPQFEHKVKIGGAAAARNPYMWSVWPAMQRMYGLLQAGELEEYYESLVLDDDTIARGLADGTLVRDDRLRRALDESCANVSE